MDEKAEFIRHPPPLRSRITEDVLNEKENDKKGDIKGTKRKRE